MIARLRLSLGRLTAAGLAILVAGCAYEKDVRFMRNPVAEMRESWCPSALSCVRDEVRAPLVKPAPWEKPPGHPD